MATVQIFKAELLAMQALLARQSAIVGSDDFDQLMTVQSEAFAHKVKTINGLDTQAIMELTEVVQQGIWKSQHKSRLCLALCNVLSDAPAGGTPNSLGKRKNQEITHFQNWAVQEEADILCSPDVAFTAKIAVAVRMMQRLGLILASEQSKGRIMQVLLAACPEFMRSQSAASTRDNFLALKRKIQLTFKNTKEPGAMGYILDYPEFPDKLHSNQFQIIFNGKEPVQHLCKVEADMAHAAGLMSLRCNSTKLKETPQAMQPLSHAQANPMQFMMQSMCNLMQQSGFPMQMQMPAAAAPEYPVRLTFTGSGSASGNAAASSRFNPAALQQCAINNGPAEPHRAPPVPAGQKLSLADLPSAGQQLALPGPDMPLSASRAELHGVSPAGKSTSSLSSELSPADQAHRFMNAMKGHELDDDDDEEVGAVLPKDNKTKSKSKAKAKAKAKGKAKAKAPAKPAAVKAKVLVFSPSIALEGSRSQWLCRPGLPFSECGESSKVFSFLNGGSKASAEKAAKKWLKDFKATHKCK